MTGTVARLRADFLLLLAALIWGTAFVAQKHAVASMGPLFFVGCRFFLSALLLAPIAWREKPAGKTVLRRSDWLLALLVGLCLFSSIGLQQIGMVTTTATNAGFLTTLYVALVPLVGWCMSGRRPSAAVALACAISVLGAWLLEQNGADNEWAIGDLWVLAGALLFALQILLVGRFLERCNRPYLLSFVQYAVSATAGLLLGGWLEPVSIEALTTTLPDILYAGLLSGGVAFTLQIVAQRHTPAAEAAIIMSLEGVFAALAGAWLLQDRLSPAGLAGCAIIFCGVILVQLAPHRAQPGRGNPLEPQAAAQQDAGPTPR